MADHSPAYTVVIPTRGADDDLERLAEQCRDPFEEGEVVVVINRPKTPERPNWSGLPGVDRIYVCVGGGAARARNIGLGVARASCVVFADDDVTLDRSAIRQLVAELRGGKAAVITARVVAHDNDHVLFKHYLAFDRGTVGRTFTCEDVRSPMDVWQLGVGAVFAVHRDRLTQGTYLPLFDERLANGRFCGGTEDVDFFFQCLQARLAVAYCPDAVFVHRFSAGGRTARERMVQYARSDGAFYAKWAQQISPDDLGREVAGWLGRVRRHALLHAGRAPAALPLNTLIREPIGKMTGVLWWRFVGQR